MVKKNKQNFPEDTSPLVFSDGQYCQHIGPKAFSNKGYTSVVIPGGVVSVGNFAFAKNKLSRVTFPDGLKEIHDAAFFGNCLTDVALPNSVEHIGDDAFALNSIRHFDIPAGLRSMGTNIFSCNRSLETVKFNLSGLTLSIPNKHCDTELFLINTEGAVKFSAHKGWQILEFTMEGIGESHHGFHTLVGYSTESELISMLFKNGEKNPEYEYDLGVSRKDKNDFMYGLMLGISELKYGRLLAYKIQSKNGR